MYRIVSITWNSFTGLKILCALPVHPPLMLDFWKPLTFYYFYSFAFSKMSYSCIIQYVAFSDYLLWFSNMHLRFLLFHALTSHIFLSLNNIILSRYITFTHWRASWLLPNFENELSLSKHLCANFVWTQIFNTFRLLPKSVMAE